MTSGIAERSTTSGLHAASIKMRLQRRSTDSGVSINTLWKMPKVVDRSKGASSKGEHKIHDDFAGNLRRGEIGRSEIDGAENTENLIPQFVN